jgi:hypothetical protein
MSTPLIPTKGTAGAEPVIENFIKNAHTLEIGKVPMALISRLFEDVAQAVDAAVAACHQEMPAYPEHAGFDERNWAMPAEAMADMTPLADPVPVEPAPSADVIPLKKKPGRKPKAAKKEKKARKARKNGKAEEAATGADGAQVEAAPVAPAIEPEATPMAA